MPCIYLCGGINALSFQEATDWREAARSAVGHAYTFRDPMRRDFRGREKEAVREIIDGDLSDISESDIVLAKAYPPSWGTGMEIFHASQVGVPVIAVCPDEKPSPWLLGHSVLVRTWNEAFALLLSSKHGYLDFRR